MYGTRPHQRLPEVSNAPHCKILTLDRVRALGYKHPKPHHPPKVCLGPPDCPCKPAGAGHGAAQHGASTVRAAATDQVTQCAMPHLTVCCMLRMLAPTTAAAIGRGADQLHKRHHGGAQGCGAHPQQHHLQRRWVRPAVNLKPALPWPGCCLQPPLQCPPPKPPGCALLSIAACLALPACLPGCSWCRHDAESGG